MAQLISYQADGTQGREAVPDHVGIVVSASNTAATASGKASAWRTGWRVSQ